MSARRPSLLIGARALRLRRPPPHAPPTHARLPLSFFPRQPSASTCACFSIGSTSGAASSLSKYATHSLATPADSFTGWHPPLGVIDENLPFVVSRTRPGNLPVYRATKGHGGVTWTTVRLISGDLEEARAELEQVCPGRYVAPYPTWALPTCDHVRHAAWRG